MLPQAVLCCARDGHTRMKMKKSASIDAFIATFPKDVQATLRTLRRTIRAAAPEAGEKIGYGIPTFTLHGNLVHFSAFATHIGFYPGPGAIQKFKKDLTKYGLAKGTVRFPLDKPLPLALIRKIVLHRVKENGRPRARKRK